MKNERRIYGLAGGAIILILTAVIYHNAVSNGFVSDDEFQIVKNFWIQDIGFLPDIFTHSLSGFSDYSFQKATYRPMMYVAFTIEYSIFGLNAAGWHLVNILIHAVNGGLVFLISVRLLQYFGGGGGEDREGSIPCFAIWLTALTAGALFISHPAASEPVSWISALPELSFTLLTLLAFYLHISPGKRGVDAGRGKAAFARYVPGPAFFFLAFLFKETAIVLPVVIFTYDVISKRAQGGQWVKRAFEKRALFLYGAYCAAFTCYMVLRVLALGHIASGGSSVNTSLRAGGLLLNAVAGFHKAMVMLFWPLAIYPFQLFKGLDSPFEVRAVLAILFTAGFVIALIYFRKKLHPIVLIALTIIVLPVLPALYAPVITRFDFAPRYIYLSSAGYGILLAFVIRWLFQKAPLKGRLYSGGLATLLSWALIMLCAFASAGKTRDWADNLSLARAGLRGSADNYLLLYQVARAEDELGHHNESIKAYRKAIAIMEGQEYRERQTQSDVLVLGAAYIAIGSVDKALETYERLIRLRPGNATAHYQLGYLYQGQGICEKALYYYGNALNAFKEPEDKKDTLLNMGNCYARLGRYETALESYREALAFVPGDVTVRKNMETLQRLRLAPSPGGKRP